MRGGQNRTHGTVGRCDRLDSFRDGVLLGPHSITWPSGSRIRLTGESGIVTLDYRVDGKPVHERITLDHLPNRYGGARTFFLCPGCGRRVRYLYLRWGRFRCRSCGRLNYRSQQHTKGDMLPYYRAAKLLRKRFRVAPELIPVPMDLPGFIPPRPKGMHWETYWRLYRELDRLKEEYHAAFMAEARRILNW